MKFFVLTPRDFLFFLHFSQFFHKSTQKNCEIYFKNGQLSVQRATIVICNSPQYFFFFLEFHSSQISSLTYLFIYLFIFHSFTIFFSFTAQKKSHLKTVNIFFCCCFCCCQYCVAFHFFQDEDERRKIRRRITRFSSHDHLQMEVEEIQLCH